MKLFLAFLLPLAIASCSDLNPKDQDDPAPPKKEEEETPEEETAEVPEPAVSPDQGVDFLPPNTTDELMNEENKKTVVGPVIPANPEPDAAEDSAIEVVLPTPSEVIKPDQD